MKKIVLPVSVCFDVCRGLTSLQLNDLTNVYLSPDVISRHASYYKLTYLSFAEKIHIQPLKKMTYHTTRPRLLAHKALCGKAKAKVKAVGFKAKAKNFGLNAAGPRPNIPAASLATY